MLAIIYCAVCSPTKTYGTVWGGRGGGVKVFGRCCVTTIPQRIGPVVVSLERKRRRTDRGQPDSRCIVRCSHVLADHASGPADSPVRAGPKVMVCGVKERKEGEKWVKIRATISVPKIGDVLGIFKNFFFNNNAFNRTSFCVKQRAVTRCVCVSVYDD